MTREERREYTREYRAKHRKEYNALMRKYRAEYPEYNDRKKKRRAERRKELNALLNKYQSEDLNKEGVKKASIRRRSSRILEKCHAKLTGYQIHHCFGYEDPEKFIYIPKSLHIMIHQFLRDNNISADTDHWMKIRDVVNSCEEYTYIRA